MNKLGILLLFTANCALAQSVVGSSNSGSLATAHYSHGVGEIYVVPVSQAGASGGTIASATQVVFGSLGNGDFITMQNVTYHPNPVKDYLTVSLPMEYSLEKAEVYDINGKRTGVRFEGNMLNMAALAPGVYMINFPESTINPIKIVKK